MSSPKVEEEGVLREWAPLSKLLQQIPQRIRCRLIYESIKFTSIDATSECISLGTSCGIVYWYDRGTHSIQELRCEKGFYEITCVRVVSTVDFMVAAGDKCGNVTIFKIPKNSVTERNYPNLFEQIERYTVDGLHKSEVTALDWSINGQKLFSGDSKGVVVFTEMDFSMNLSKAREILNERYSIVQLSFNQHEQALVVSTELRCILWHNGSSDSKITQIGQRERSSLLPLGGVFFVDAQGNKAIYTCRSGLKLWKANLKGEVEYTLIFKDALKKAKNNIKLLKAINRLEENEDKVSGEFGRIYPWRDGLFVSYTKHNLLVFDPAQVSFAAVMLNIGNLASLCRTGTELFLITGHRDLIRLGYTPDLYDSCVGGLGNLSKGECVSSIPEISLEPVPGAPITLPTVRNYLSAPTANLKMSSKEVTYGTDLVVLPGVVSIQDGIPELRVDPTTYQQFTSIGQQDFDDIIFSQMRPQRHKKKKKKKKSDDNGNAPGTSWSGLASYVNNFGTFISGELSPPICDGEMEHGFRECLPKDVLPDTRTLDTIGKEVARKEVLLEASLERSLSRLLEDKSTSKSVGSVQSNAKNDEPTNESADVDTETLLSSSKQKVEVESFDENCSAPKVESVPFSSFKETNDAEGNIIIDNVDGKKDTSHGTNKINIVGKENSSMVDLEISSIVASLPRESCLEGTFSETEAVSSVIVTWTEDEIIHLDKTENDRLGSVEAINSYSSVSENDPMNESTTTYPFNIVKSKTNGAWCEVECPERAIWLAVWSGGLLMCSPALRVYYSNDQLWMSFPYRAQALASSPTGDVSVRLHCATAYYTEGWIDGKDWKVLCRDVDHVALSEDKVWFISREQLFYFTKTKGNIQPHRCEFPLSKVYSWQSGLLAVSKDGTILKYRNDVWRIVKGNKKCKFLSTGPNNLVWIVDNDNILYVTDNIDDRELIWWQVPFTDAYCVVTSLCSSEDGVYLSCGHKASIFLNKSFVSGHIWEPKPLDLKCTQVTASGVFEEKGCLWVLDRKNDLLAISSSLVILKELTPPCNVVCVSSVPQALWILSDTGHIYIRQGISDSCPTGTQWGKLNLEQLNEQALQIVGISCGTDVVWACDIRGLVLMVVGSPHLIASNISNTPAWVIIEGRPTSNNTFTKIYVGPETYMVWALDSAGNIYVREGIFPDFLVGTGWVHVPDVKASHLTINSDSVYALNMDGVYKRVGISPSNYIGDAWLYLPVRLDYITASFDHGLWGISSDTGLLVSHQERVFPLSDLVTVEKDWALL